MGFSKESFLYRFELDQVRRAFPDGELCPGSPPTGEGSRNGLVWVLLCKVGSVCVVRVRSGLSPRVSRTVDPLTRGRAPVLDAGARAALGEAKSHGQDLGRSAASAHGSSLSAAWQSLENSPRLRGHGSHCRLAALSADPADTTFLCAPSRPRGT